MYTDACRKENDTGIGGMIFELDSGRKYAFTTQTPEWLVQLMHELSGECNINQLETIALIAGIHTFEQLVMKKRLLIFSDSITALVATISGWAKQPDMARLTCIYHLLLYGMQIDSWHEHVPGIANPADWPSRLTGQVGQQEAERLLTQAGYITLPTRIPEERYIRDLTLLLRSTMQEASRE